MAEKSETPPKTAAAERRELVGAVLDEPNAKDGIKATDDETTPDQELAA